MTLDGSVLSEGLDAVGSGEPETPAPPAATAPGAGETEPEGSAPVASQVNWDDPANPYIERFKGLQGAVQRQVERSRQLERQLNELREQQVRQQVAHLDPVQQQQVLAHYRQTQQLAQQQQALREYEARLENVARIAVAKDFAAQYAVDVQEIIDLPTPELMERWAKRLAQQRQVSQREAQRQVRQVQGQDRFEGNLVTPAPKPPEPPKTLDEGEARFAELVRERFARR